MGAASASTYVKVKAKATMTLSKSSVKVGKTVTFSGKVKPKTGSLVELQRRQGSTWVTKKTVVPAADGTYSTTWKPTSKVDYSWRVRVSGATFKTGVSAHQGPRRSPDREGSAPGHGGSRVLEDACHVGEEP